MIVMPMQLPRPYYEKSEETAAKQRPVSLFSRWPNRRRPRVSAQNEMLFADNLREKQRKQPEPLPGRPVCGSAGRRL
jgi:hypothetical protein